MYKMNTCIDRPSENEPCSNDECKLNTNLICLNNMCRCEPFTQWNIMFCSNSKDVFNSTSLFCFG